MSKLYLAKKLVLLKTIYKYSFILHNVHLWENFSFQRCAYIFPLNQEEPQGAIRIEQNQPLLKSRTGCTQISLNPLLHVHYDKSSHKLLLLILTQLPDLLHRLPIKGYCQISGYQIKKTGTLHENTKQAIKQETSKVFQDLFCITYIESTKII